MSPEEKPPPGRSHDECSPQPATGRGRRRGGLLTEIRTPIRTEPFQQRYSLSPGRELGRWVCGRVLVRGDLVEL